MLPGHYSKSFAREKVFYYVQLNHVSNSNLAYFSTVFEGLFTSQFDGDDTPIEASVGSSFYDFLDCANSASGGQPCMGTVGQCESANCNVFNI